MTVEIKVPVLPESVADALIAKWYKNEGDVVSRDENLVDLETDKVMLEVPAPQGGVLEKVFFREGATVMAGQVLAIINEASSTAVPSATHMTPSVSSAPSADTLSPSARRAVTESGVDVATVLGSGKDGRITKHDVLLASNNNVVVENAVAITRGARQERRVAMSRLRQRIAERLVQSQQEAAILTTFNEVNMKPVMDLRAQYKDQFEKKYGTKLGFMSFFTKAVIEALKRFPAVNASIDGTDIIYHDFYDIGIAIGSSRGLVVPIIRDADSLSMAGIESAIKDFAARAAEGKIAIDELTGGTFTITNGGTYGSMMSTPIINPPQTAILGMHNIVERPVVEHGQIVIRPMMYVALSYDHRVIDGSESVRFLVTIKDMIEDPARLLLEV